MLRSQFSPMVTTAAAAETVSVRLNRFKKALKRVDKADNRNFSVLFCTRPDGKSYWIPVADAILYRINAFRSGVICVRAK